MVYKLTLLLLISLSLSSNVTQLFSSYSFGRIKSFQKTSDDQIVIATEDGTVAKIDALTGVTLWQRDFNDKVDFSCGHQFCSIFEHSNGTLQIVTLKRNQLMYTFNLKEDNPVKLVKTYAGHNNVPYTLFYTKQTLKVIMVNKVLVNLSFAKQPENEFLMCLIRSFSLIFITKE